MHLMQLKLLTQFIKLWGVYKITSKNQILTIQLFELHKM